jgi:plasmid stabilization system protein ParE
VQSYKVEITGTAKSDITEIFDHIARDKPVAATKFVMELERQIRSLKKHPLRCPVIPEAAELKREYRHLLYGSYRTIFKVSTKSVIIIRVIHGARLLDLSVFS